MNNEMTTIYADTEIAAKCKSSCIDNFANGEKVWTIFYKTIKGEEFVFWIGYTMSIDDVLRMCKEFKEIDIIDNRDKGFYCCYCKTFLSIAIMSLGIQSIKIIDGKHVLVNEHYDGCRGWN